MAASTLPAATAVLLTAVTGVVLPGAAASASAAAAAVCPGATGVTVVVDYNEVGGPTRAGCAPDGAGDSASQVFPDAGFSLGYHPRQPGYVCLVTGLPDDRPCLENDSFWSLWWSDGTSGEWRFANQGVGGLTVPDGGYLAFSWHEGGGRADPPDFAPTSHQAPVEPSEQPSDTDGEDTGNGGNDDGDQDGGATSTAPTDAATTATGATASESTSGAAMPDGPDRSRDTEATDPTSDSSESTVPGAAEITAGPPPSDLGTESGEDDGGALPTWIGLALAVLVLGAAGLVTVLRRRAG